MSGTKSKFDQKCCFLTRFCNFWGIFFSKKWLKVVHADNFGPLFEIFEYMKMVEINFSSRTISGGYN